MRLLIVLPMLALAACSVEKTETDSPNASTMSASPAAAVDLATLAGTWEGTVMPVGKDTALTTLAITATGTKDGWIMKLAGNDVPLTVTTDADSVITTAAGFPSALRKGATVKSLHSIFRVHGDMMMGMSHVSYDNGDTTTLRTDLTRKK
jgi:hypothetical protein